MFPKLKRRTFPATSYWEFAVSRRYIYEQAMHFHMTIEPLWVFKWWLLKQMHGERKHRSIKVILAISTDDRLFVDVL